MAANRETYQEAIRLYVETSGDKELGALAAQLTKLGQGADASAAQAEALVDELDKLASVGNNIRGFTTLKASIADTGDALTKAKAAAATLKAEFDAAETPTKKLAAAMVRADASVEKLTKQQNRQQAELARTSGALRNAGVDTTNLAAAYDDLQGELGSLGERATLATNAMERTGKESKKAADGIGLIERASDGAGKSLASIGARLTAVAAAATAALAAMAAAGTAALFTGAIRSAATLEDALSQVRAVSGATAEEMVALKQAAEAGGAATRFSTLEAAQGLGELARATGSAATAIGALPATLNLAQAAGIGVSEAAVLMTTTLTQFGLGADQATRVADVMAKEVNATTDSMEGLGNALTYAAPLAKQLGLDLEDTAAILGVLADQGFRGERAGTALRNVFSAMSDPASTFAGALRDIGIQSTDFATVIGELAAKGDLGREALLQLDAAARPAITALVDGGSAKLAELEASLRSATGEAERTAGVMGDNLSGAMESMKDSFDRARRSLVEPLLAPLQDELQALATELETFAQSAEFEEIKGALKTLFVEGAQAARELIDKVDFQALAQKIRDFATDADGSLTEFKENLGTVVDAVVIVGQTFSVVFNAVQSVVLTVAAAIARAMAEIAKRVEKMTESSRTLGEFFGVLDKGQYSLSEFIGGMGAVADEFEGRLSTNIGETIEAVQALAGASEESGQRTADGLGKVGDAAGALADSSAQIAEAAAEATAALDGQAKGAVTAAAATSGAAVEMVSGAERLKKAFADMGIQSQQELGRAAETAKRNFDLIRGAVSSGTASAEDARRAFAAYAQAARAAVADSDASAQLRVEGELMVQSAVLGATASLKAMGDTGKSAGQDVAKGAGQAASSLQAVGEAAAGAAAATADAAEGAAAAGDNMEYGSKKGKQFALSMYEVSDAALAMTLATNKYAGSPLWVGMINRVTDQINDQGKALNAQVETLKAANGEFDELAGRRNELKNEYNLLGAGEIEKLLQAEQQLEANRKRAAEQRQREAEQLAKASEPAPRKSADVAAVQIAQRETAAVVSGVLASTQQAAAALSSAAASVRTAVAGEIVVRFINDPGNATPIKISDAQMRDIALEVVRRLRQAKGSST